MIPGFVDLHINGSEDVCFTSRGITRDQLHSLAAKLVQRGVIGFCPTVQPCSIEDYQVILPTVASRTPVSCAANLGIHLEGPFLNPECGYYPPARRQYLADPDIELFEKLRKMAHDRIALVSISPELPGAIQLISHITEKSPHTVVSLAHTNADASVISNACDAGATLVTHFGNGINEDIHRHRNPLWTLLAEDRLSALFITDGYHLPPELIRVGLRAKGHRRFIVSSGSVASDGMDCNGSKEMLCGTETVDDCYARPNHLDMLDCMNYLASLDILTEKRLLDVGCLNALRALRCEDLEAH